VYGNIIGVHRVWSLIGSIYYTTDVFGVTCFTRVISMLDLNRNTTLTEKQLFVKV